MQLPEYSVDRCRRRLLCLAGWKSEILLQNEVGKELVLSENIGVPRQEL